MKNVWNWIDSKNWNVHLKVRIIILIFITASSAAGLFVWSIIRLWLLDHWSWMIVFTGSPAFFSLVAIVIYSFNHSYHNGAYEHNTKLKRP